jgi:hypothetical protein
MIIPTRMVVLFYCTAELADILEQRAEKVLYPLTRITASGMTDEITVDLDAFRFAAQSSAVSSRQGNDLMRSKSLISLDTTHRPASRHATGTVDLTSSGM